MEFVFRRFKILTKYVQGCGEIGVLTAVDVFLLCNYCSTMRVSKCWLTRQGVGSVVDSVLCNTVCSGVIDYTIITMPIIFSL
jgi:hypothetical protein